MDGVVQYFTEHPAATAYFAVVDASGNAKASGTHSSLAPLLTSFVKVLQSVIAQSRKLGKSVYVFTIDQEQKKVAHANYVADDAKAKGLDGRTWANAVSDVIGGKV